MKFNSITFLPNGQIYDNNNWSIDELLEHSPYELTKYLTLDSIKRKVIINSPIGELELVWTGSDIFGVSTLLKNGVTINTGVFLPGNDKKEETSLLKFYLNTWREFKIVTELCKNNTPFQEAEEIKERPLLVSVNWSTINKEEYDQIAYYDLFIASKYFQSIGSI